MDDMEQDQEPRPSHHVCYALSGPEIPPVVPQISKPVPSVFPENIWIDLGLEGAKTVSLAPQATARAGRRSLYCTPCSPGFYQDMEASQSCKPCEAGFYA